MSDHHEVTVRMSTNMVQHSRIHLARSKECFGCDRMFESHSAMLIHLESGRCTTTMDELDFYAQECLQHKKYIVDGFKEVLRTNSRDTYKAELQWESYYQRWECVICERLFNSIAAARAHTSSPTHDPKPYKCPCCGTRFSVLSALMQHVESDYCDATVAKPGAMWKLLHYLEYRIAPE